MADGNESYRQERWGWKDGKPALLKSFTVTDLDSETKLFIDNETGERFRLRVILSYLAVGDTIRIATQSFINQKSEGYQAWNINRSFAGRYGAMGGYLSSPEAAIACAFAHLESRVLNPTALQKQ